MDFLRARFLHPRLLDGSLLLLDLFTVLLSALNRLDAQSTLLLQLRFFLILRCKLIRHFLLQLLLLDLFTVLLAALNRLDFLRARFLHPRLLDGSLLLLDFFTVLLAALNRLDFLRARFLHPRLLDG